MENVLSWYDLLFTGERYEKWLVFFLGLVDSLAEKEIHSCKDLRQNSEGPHKGIVIIANHSILGGPANRKKNSLRLPVLCSTHEPSTWNVDASADNARNIPMRSFSPRNSRYRLNMFPAHVAPQGPTEYGGTAQPSGGAIRIIFEAGYWR
jgi:hypothetical protein